MVMTMSIDRFLSDKAALRTNLEQRARSRRTLTYGDAAALVGRSTAGLAPLLTSIRVEEAMQRRPDLGALVVRMDTGLPSYVGPGQDAREKAVAVQEAVFAAWVGSKL